jgi:hypothetical protein
MNNYKLLLPTLLFTFLTIFDSAALATTTDGQTPADEIVCDSLKADGVTKGLYGLCVAFCEAQDFADVTETTTDSELLNLMKGAPSGKILAAYNRKKSATDPGMPCIVEASACPCFTDTEVADMDGVYDGQTLTDFNCRRNTDGLISVYEADPSPHISITVAPVSYAGPTNAGCMYQNRQINPPTGVDRVLTIGAGTITSEEVDICASKLSTQCAANGM